MDSFFLRAPILRGRGRGRGRGRPDGPETACGAKNSSRCEHLRAASEEKEEEVRATTATPRSRLLRAGRRGGRQVDGVRSRRLHHHGMMQAQRDAATTLPAGVTPEGTRFGVGSPVGTGGRLLIRVMRVVHGNLVWQAMRSAGSIESGESESVVVSTRRRGPFPRPVCDTAYAYVHSVPKKIASSPAVTLWQIARKKAAPSDGSSGEPRIHWNRCIRTPRSWACA